jgi:deoxycytidylate deaminase
MADNIDSKSKNKIKTSFINTKSLLISERVTKNLELLKRRHSDEQKNIKKEKMCRNVTAEVNALCICYRTEAEMSKEMEKYERRE